MVKVFISWSGEVSRQVACVLHDWLPHVIQAIKPFISADMRKGTRWSNVLTQELNDTDFGIVCVTSSNFKKPWLNFEGGALSKSITQGQVSPFLFRVDPDKIEGPLSQFQFTKYDKNDIFSLLTSMCKKLNPEDQLDPKLLREEFDQWWGTLDAKLSAIKDEDALEDITGYDWLYPPEWLTKMEANDKFSSIWIITSTNEHLYQHSIDKAVKDAVKSNMENHVEYRYIIPESVFKKSDELYHDDLRDVFHELIPRSDISQNMNLQCEHLPISLS